MEGLGQLIKSIRREKGMTVAEISEGVCSERFTYMVENKDQSPSVTILKEFSERLGVNLFEYFDYIGCSRPIQSKDLGDRSKALRYKREYDRIREITDEIENSEDAENYLLKYEILCNQINLELYFMKNREKAKELIIKGILELSGKTVEEVLQSGDWKEDFYFANLFNYLFVYYKAQGEEEKASRILSFLNDGIQNLSKVGDFKVLAVSIMINYLHDEIFIHRSTECLEELEQLLESQIKENNLNRVFLTYYLFFGHYYNRGELIKAREYFKKFVAAGESTGIEMQYRELLNGLDENMFLSVCPEGAITFDVKMKRKLWI